jgi:hypothetical protein
MTTQTNTVSAHLIAAADLIHATARETVRTTEDAQTALSHIDAAAAFITAAEFYYEAAERIAAGQPVGSNGLVLAVKFAEAKALEGRGMLGQGENPTV